MGLVSVARARAHAAYEAGWCDVTECVTDDPTWTADDDAAVHEHLLLNPPSLLDDPRLARVEAVEALADLERQRSWMVAQQQRVMVALAGAERHSRNVTVWDEDHMPRTVDLVDEAVELIAVVLQRSPVTVRRQVAVARMLACLPCTTAALESGALGVDHAEWIARSAHGLPEPLLADFEGIVLGRVLTPGAVLTPHEVGAFARRVRARLDATGEDARRARARRLEDVRIWPEDDGLACLQARLPLADAARVHAALNERARREPYDPDHSMGMRRAAALVDAVCGNTSAGEAAGVAVQVTVDLATLAGLTDEPAMVDMPTGAPEPITAGALRELLADPRVPVSFRRLVVDPVTGQVLDRGRSCYRVPNALRAFLMARDVACRFPGCTRRSEHCDIDHVTAWADGGATDRANLIPLCRRHHVMKTFGPWSILEHRADGAVLWEAPDGRRIVDLPWRSNLPPPPTPPPTVPAREGLPDRGDLPF